MSKILIIEDELSIAELERDYLELNDFEVEIETNGLNGLEKALSEEYSLILLDLMLPDMDGFEICRQIREKRTEDRQDRQKSICRQRGEGIYK